MNKQQLSILERAFALEIEGALLKHFSLLQTKSKVALQLAEEGYLESAEDCLHGVTVKGYRLTHLGRITYCAICEIGS